MAFRARALSRFATSDRIRQGRSNAYVYSTEDSGAELAAAGYFDAAARRFGLKAGDVIDCTVAVSGTPAKLALVVTQVLLGAVTVAPVGAVVPGASVPLQMAKPTLTAGDAQIKVEPAAAPGDGGSPITSYDARRSTDGQNWTITTGIASGQALAGLANGTPYQVQTAAVNAIGRGPWSPSETATPAVASNLVPIGAVMNATGDGIASEGSAAGLRNMWGVFERRLGLRMQPSPVSLIARSGTTIARTIGTNTPWIYPLALDAQAAQKADVPFFLTCGANDDVLSTDPVASPASLNDWKTAVSYYVQSNPQALRLPIMMTWPSGKGAEATYRATVWNLQRDYINALKASDPRVVLIDCSSIVPAEVANDANLVHPHEIGADKGAQLIMAAIEPHLAPATKAQVLDMIFAGTYPKMGAQRDPDRDLAVSGSGVVTAPVQGTVPSSKAISTTTGSNGIVASLVDTTNGRKKQVIRAGGSGSAAGIIKYEDKTALPLALTPGQYALAGMGAKLPPGYLGYGFELGSVAQSGSYQAAANAGTTAPISYTLDTILIARPSAPATSVGTAKKTISFRYGAGALPEADIEIEQPFGWAINDRTRHRPAHLGAVATPLALFGVLSGGAGTIRVNPGSFVPAGLTETDFAERRIYKGGDATIGSGTLVATLTGSTWTWATSGIVAGDALWAEVDANNGVGAKFTARSSAVYTAA
ncbi:fibronectin type III domain-containing protein [Aureimonas sp. AU12]|uniref:fibronectin type III domain-containing protein n=1 Tax=Aureimonas sp. AU12 TaxID=1638161 RepID=UPI000783AEE4|nr:fibronectin type III domain-containing protein [Aureimonas sp. AU12]